jgi:pyruvate/2-oxoglutarate/acetoin dehydrogenase E1 component
VVDLRSLVPLDIDTVIASAKKTGRIVIAHEAPRTCGYGAELVAQIQERAFLHLEAPIERVTGLDTPFPHTLEHEYLPDAERICEAALATLQF